MKYLIATGVLLLAFACNKEMIPPAPNLADYLALNTTLELADLVACAGGSANGLLGEATHPTDVFFYPVPGATDFRYFEAENVADSLDFSQYRAKELNCAPVFNGYLWKFDNTPFVGERMGIVTYKTPGKIHVCTPIRLKTNRKPTEVNPGLVTVTENGTTPTFRWADGQIRENVIYFQVISDSENNFISGTYTVESTFTFYDLQNVVFNITSDPSPSLAPNQNYKFTLMGVSEDNWINLFAEVEFTAE